MTVFYKAQKLVTGLLMMRFREPNHLHNETFRVTLY